jgi:hypothetical protein
LGPERRDVDAFEPLELTVVMTGYFLDQTPLLHLANTTTAGRRR